MKKFYESPEFDKLVIQLTNSICASTNDPVEDDGIGGGDGGEKED